MLAPIVTVIGRKGGCGKSTLVTSLAGAIAATGEPVLVIDLDSQASATRCLFGFDKPFTESNSVPALFADPNLAAAQVIHESPIENIHCLPSSEVLDRYMIPHHGQNLLVLAPLLRQVRDQYAAVLIDTPPNTNAWPTRAALHTSHWATTPLIPDAFGAHSSVDTLRVITAVNRARFLGFILTMIERNSVTAEYIKVIRKKYQTDVFKTEIPKAVAFKDATASGIPITHLSPKPPAAKIITTLVNEIGTRTASRVRKAA